MGVCASWPVGDYLWLNRDIFPGDGFPFVGVGFWRVRAVDGIFAIVAVFISGAHAESWWWLVLEGAFGILIGILTLLQPVAMGIAWILVIAVWAIVTGVLEVFTAINLRKTITNEGWMVLSGVLSILFGLLAAFYPQSGAFAIGLVVGIYALMFGITLLMLAFRLRKHA